MFNKLKFAALAAMVSAAPMSADALTFWPRSLDPGDTYLVSADHTDRIEDGIFGIDNPLGSSPFSYDFTITNDTAAGQTILFDLRYLTFLDGLSMSLTNFVTGATDDFTATLAAGQSETFTLAVSNPTSNPGGRLNIQLALVPVPAAGLLFLTALGGMVAMRRRKTGLAAA